MDTIEKNENDKSLTPRPDPATLHTTDPQEKMEGPVSSSMKGIGEAFESKETKEHADEKKDRNL